MRALLTGLTALGCLALAACESDSQYDGVSRFADSSYLGVPYYGPGSPPRES
jgi:hypothetical protein